MDCRMKAETESLFSNQFSDSPTKDDLLQLEFGNKIAILTGDYLLAQSCVALADLRNTYVVEIVTMAIADFTQSEFVGARDVQGSVQQSCLSSQFVFQCCNLSQLLNTQRNVEFHLNLHFNLPFRSVQNEF